MMSSAIRRSIAARTGVISRPAFAARQFSIASGRYARKDAMGKDDLKPEPNEYSKSASDDQAARVEKTAFDANQTSPESQEASAGQEGAEKGKSNNPLDASPANHELSHVNDAKKGQPEESPSESPGHEGGRARTSGGGGAPKSGGGKYGGGTSG